MDQDSVHMVAASKVHMLKPSEYELWRMRMEQYIQMIDYSLWEVIKNGNAPPITKVVEGVETTIAPTTAKEKAQRRLELKARSTLLMGIPNEHQLKFNSIKDAKSLLQAFSTAHGATTASAQATTVNSTTIDNLSDALDLEVGRMDYITMRARRFLKNTRRKLTVNGNETIRENTRRIVPVETTTSNALVSCDGFSYDWSDQAEEDKGVIDSGCSRHMTGNMSYLTDYEEIDGGYVAFGGNPKGGKITGKGYNQN
ncbi:hypothetical protein Tco_0662833 [Tanacetum coccineum]